MQINGFNKTTLLDYPKHLASTVFLGGCNFRCPFCHNASLVLRPGTQPVIPVDEVMSYLRKRKGILEGVCITGGEPTLYPDLPDFIKSIKDIGYKVKLDTNGSNSSMLKKLADNHLIDYVAMDLKNSKEKYSLTIGTESFNINNICESITYLLSGSIDYEFRTTIIREFHTKEDMLSIGEWIKGAKAYYLQAYKDSGDLIEAGLNGHTKETMLYFKDLIAPYVDSISLRGID